MSNYKMESWEERVERSKAIRYILFEGQRYQPCMWCSIPMEIDEATIEHLTPNSHGGPLTVSNAGLACQSCNNKRGTRSIEEFRASAWLQEKRRQVVAAKNNRIIPNHQDGTPMDDSEIRLAAQLYLNTLDKGQLLAIIMGMAKQTQIDRFASNFMELNQ